MNQMSDWMHVGSYTMARKKDGPDGLVAMAKSLHYAWMTLKDEHRKLELAHIESRATCVAYAAQIEANAETLRKYTVTLNRASRAEQGEFTFAELGEASKRYCDLHGCKSVPMDVLKAALRKGKI